MKRLIPTLIALFVITIGLLKGQSTKFEIGEIVPSFTLIDQHGDEISLSDYRGKLIVLDFWASYCGPCRQQTETFFKPLHKDLNSTNFEILSISKDKDLTKWKKALEEDQMSWPQLCLILNSNNVSHEYSVDYLPTVIVIDKDGRFLGRNMSKLRLIETIYNNIEPSPDIPVSELHDVTKEFKDWEEFLEDLNYEIDSYVYEKTIYPESAKSNGISGSIPVMLTIGKDYKLELLVFLKNVPGSKGKVKVKYLGHGCEEEVQRVIKSMKNWKSFPYVKMENTYSTTTVFHFPPKKPIRQNIELNY